MKRLLFLVMILGTFFAAFAQAQYLQSEDIDIFLNPDMAVPMLMIGYNRDTDETWRQYAALLDNFTEQLDSFTTDKITGQALRVLKNSFQDFMNCPVPPELEAAFHLMGWTNNGHQKLWTILFTFEMLSLITIMDRDPENLEAENAKILMSALLSIFDSGDVELVRKNVERIMIFFEENIQ